MDIPAEIRRLLDAGRLDLPAPGAGQTALRHARLAELGRRDLSLGRLAEAHSDALAILAQAGLRPRPGALYGVWAARRPGASMRARPAPGGGLIVEGRKDFCTGVSLCDAALVTVEEVQGGAPGDGPLLVDIDLRAGRDRGRVRVFSGDWASQAFADTATGSVEIDALEVGGREQVGPPGWYLTRSGFWHGALGPAAVWAGGARGLADVAFGRGRGRDPDSLSAHYRAHMGALDALVWSMGALLKTAGDEIDADPGDRQARARVRALRVRHLIDRQAQEIAERFGRSMGPAPLAFDAAVARRHAELLMYLRQCHAEADLEALYRCLPGAV